MILPTTRSHYIIIFPVSLAYVLLAVPFFLGGICIASRVVFTAPPTTGIVAYALGLGCIAATAVAQRRSVPERL